MALTSGSRVEDTCCKNGVQGAVQETSDPTARGVLTGLVALHDRFYHATE